MYSIQKKRGVDDQIPGALFALGSCDCPIDTRVEETDVNDVATFPSIQQAPDGLTYSTARRMWQHPQGDFIYALEWDALFGRHFYNNPRTILWRVNILDGSFQTVPLVPPIDSSNFTGAQIFNLHSDEPSYGTFSSGRIGYYSINNNQRYIFRSQFGGISPNVVVKEGDFVYGVNRTSMAADVTRKIQEWSFPLGAGFTGTVQVATGTLPIRISGDIFDTGSIGSPTQMVATNSWIYCIVPIDPGSGLIDHVMRIRRSDLTVESIFNLNLANATTHNFMIDAVSDSLLYIVDSRPNNNNSRLLYLDDMETLFQVDVGVTDFFTGSFSGGMAYVHRGCVYVGNTGGLGGSDLTIHKICELVCPGTDTPIGT